MNQSTSLVDTLGSLAPLDKFGLGLVLLLILLGVWRGLWWQVIRLAGLMLAVVVARFLSPEASSWIMENSSEISPRVAHGIAWGSIFMLSLGAATILGMLGQRLLEAMQMGVLNRMGGAVIGACTGIVIHVALLVALSQLAPEEFVSKHMGGTYSSQLLDRAGSQWRVVLGKEAAEHVDRLIGEHLPNKHNKSAPPVPSEEQNRLTTRPGGVR